MANLRIIYNNAIDRATLVASSTAGSLVAANMQSDRKSKIWRSTGLVETITATWTTAEFLNGLAIPFCSLSSTGTVRVRGYVNVSDPTPLFDTTAVLAAPYIPLASWAWGEVPLGVNAYSYGNNTYGRVWFDNTYSVKKLVIDIDDTGNSLGYLEIGRLVTGRKWQPTYNTGFGIPISMVDTSTHERTESGDMLTVVGTRYKKITFDLAWMNSDDRAQFNVLMKNNGMTKPMYISLFPDDPDIEKEQTYQIYGKLPQIASMTHPMFTIYSSQIDIEEI